MNFITSDTHYGHTNICRATTTWGADHTTRDFRSLQEMNDTIVDNINKIVKEDDTLYHLGDWSFGGIDKIEEFRNRLICKDIQLCYGNHDRHIEKNLFLRQKLFTHCADVRFLKINNISFFLSHYSHRVWLDSGKGSIHLFGHSHGSLNHQPWGKSMDIGVDSAYSLYGEYRPFKIEEIIGIMNKRDIYKIDHH